MNVSETKRPANCNKVTPLAENSDPATRNPSLLLSGAELNKGSITVQIDTPWMWWVAICDNITTTTLEAAILEGPDWHHQMRFWIRAGQGQV
jgi:hypothetical protein